MLPMTKDLLNKAHIAFDEFGYKPSSDQISYVDLYSCMVKTLNHTKELEDAIETIKLFHFLYKNFEKICSCVTKHYDYWQSLPYEGNEMLSLVDDDEATGVYFITNAFDKDFKHVYACSHSLTDNNGVNVNYHLGKFSFEIDDPRYFLRFSKLSPSKMVLLDKSDNKLCVIVLSEDYQVFLENNKTDYEIVLYEGGMGIYKKSYIKSLGGYDPDTDNMLAFIEWDIIDEKVNLGIARLDFYGPDGDVELFLMFAMSCFLLFRSFIKKIESVSLINSPLSPAWRNHMLNHR